MTHRSGQSWYVDETYLKSDFNICFQNLLSGQRLMGRRSNRGKTPGTDAFFVCLGSAESDSSYV